MALSCELWGGRLVELELEHSSAKGRERPWRHHLPEMEVRERWDMTARLAESFVTDDVDVVNTKTRGRRISRGKGGRRRKCVPHLA